MINIINNIVGNGDAANGKKKKEEGKISQTVQAEIGEKLWVSKKKDEDFSRLWEVYGVASLSADKRRVFVADEVTKKIWEVPAEETLNYDPCHDIDFTDLTRMNYLHEASLLNTLQKRYMNDDIYTYFGDTLISINPYYAIPGLYEKSVDVDTPHVYSIAKKTFDILQKKRRSQSIVINGDSGAGKTEAAKHIMRNLVSLCLENSSGTTPEIENLVLESTPVLEAFGNSVTLRNDNSSRFGRFIQIIYNDKGDAITGMNTLHFLLEKSRLIRRSPGERNYHIFYQCCAGMQSMGFSEPSSYNYLLPLLDANNYRGSLPDDRAGFKRTTDALSHIGIDSKTQHEIWKVLLAILNIGNIDFVTSEEDKDNTGKCRLAHASLLSLETAALNLNISHAKDLESAMTQRTIEAGRNNETTVIDLTVDQARDSRDALAKFLFSAVFDWVIEELNRQSSKSSDNRKGNNKKDRFIGILDIFGFEDLEKNSFEQVCVNYANELLQKQFDFYVIESERRVFKDEGVAFPDITLPSIINSEKVLDLLTNNLFSILEEQCLLRSGTDEGFLSNLEKKKVSNDKFEMDWKNRNGFIVKHFAGEVRYDSTGFVEKNRDALTTDLKELIQMNCSELLAQQLGSSAEERSRKMAAKETVLKKFQKDMNNLVSTITKTDQVFIRCIKPNRDQSLKEWDVKLILSQLEYLGIVQAIRVHQETYPIRREFSFIAEKYYSLLAGDNRIEYVRGKNDLEVMKRILFQTLGKESEFKLWQVGYTKVFLGNEVLYALDSIVNQKRLAALNAMSEVERNKKLEEERKKQEKELKEARERFEREKKEEEERRKRLEEEKLRVEAEERRKRLEEEDLERRRKLKQDEEKIRLEQEQMRNKLLKEEEQSRLKIAEEKEKLRNEAETKMKQLQAEEARRTKELEEKEKRLQDEEAAKNREWEEKRAKIQEEETERLKRIATEQANMQKMTEQRKAELEEEERRRKKFLLEQEQRIRQEELETRKRWEEEQQKLEREEEARRLLLKQEDEKAAKEREEKRKILDAEEKRIQEERARLVQLEKERLRQLEEEEQRRRAELEERNKRILEEQNKLAAEQKKLSALEQSKLKELEERQNQLKAERQKTEEEQRLREQKLLEEEERLKAQEERLRLLEEDRLLRLAQETKEREAENRRKEQEEQERLRIKKEKAEKRKQEKQAEKEREEKNAEKRAKLARRRAKIEGALAVQTMFRRARIRMNYKDMMNRRTIFKDLLKPNELVVFSSLVVNANAMSGKKRVLIVTSEARLLLVHPVTFKIDEQSKYDPLFCKAVAGGLDGKELDIYLRDAVKQDKQIIWKVKDLLNDAATWVAVLDSLSDTSNYINKGFSKVLNGRVSRKNIAVPVKFGSLKVLESAAERQSASRFSLGKRSEEKGILFVLTEKDRKYTLTWYESEKDIQNSGQLPVDRRMKVAIPDTSSIGGHLNVFVFCLRVKKAKAEKLYTIQAKGKEDRDSWVKVLKDAITTDKSGKKTEQLKEYATLKRNNEKKKKSFNAAQFMDTFSLTDKTTHQNLKHFGSRRTTSE